MSQATVVFDNGRYNGRTLREWLPSVVARIVDRCDPLQIVLFGSLVKGTDDRDSDIDLLVVLDQVADKDQALLQLLRATEDLPVPVDAIPSDLEELRTKGKTVGNILRSALSSGITVYER